MQQLELIRFDFLPLATHGIMYARDGWTCFTMENTVRPDDVFLPGSTAAPEGLYKVTLQQADNTFQVMVTENDGNGMQPIRICAGTRPHLLSGAIGIGYSLDLLGAVMSGGDDAMCEITARLAKDPEAMLTVRHLDARRYQHLQRMKVKQMPKKEG